MSTAIPEVAECLESVYKEKGIEPIYVWARCIRLDQRPDAVTGILTNC
jgi:hypothetical protein